MANMNNGFLVLSDQDNVVVALREMAEGEPLPRQSLTCRQVIPSGHKAALQEIKKDQPVYKYGQIIGFAVRDILPGEHVHDHNIEFRDFSRSATAQGGSAMRGSLKDSAPTFQGIVRPDGRIATRNYIGVLATCNCSAGMVRTIASQFTAEFLADFPNVDGVTAFEPVHGCGMSGSGLGFEYLQRVTTGFMRQPNFGGLVVVGLGCEVNNLDSLFTAGGFSAGPKLVRLNIQDCGGTPGTIKAGVEAIKAMLPEVNQIKRQPVPISEIVLGLECGGSDAYSGISANPALGKAADLLVSYGGTVILAETPEIFGAEHLLAARAVSEDVAGKLLKHIDWWRDYTARNGAEINNNPVPGNKAGGLSTILEKSLGAAAKGGSGELVEVYGYAEPVTQKGLVFMDTPGYDAVSLTGMAAGGANMFCFTTGRGTPCALRPVPTVKLISNTPAFKKMPDDFDINCGRIIDGETDIETLGREILDKVIKAASGEKTRSEIYGYGVSEYAPWQIGAVL